MTNSNQCNTCNQSPLAKTDDKLQKLESFVQRLNPQITIMEGKTTDILETCNWVTGLPQPQHQLYNLNNTDFIGADESSKNAYHKFLQPLQWCFTMYMTRSFISQCKFRYSWSFRALENVVLAKRTGCMDPKPLDDACRMEVMIAWKCRELRTIFICCETNATFLQKIN